ncbi:hypothetical protein [Agrococcus jejuensis]|uniref:hypothetical protein n=1 Tax=Agrococcus jejuensis TaxID=399736 RepID=UPI0011A41202|nr:hypothetical protein [Agrococcus jejuensis]
MSTITEHFNIPGPVPFIDLDVAIDNRLFVDPHAVRLMKTPKPYADDAVHCIDTFLTEIVRCITSGNPADLRRGEDLLQHFKEPWETRMGMSKRGFRGHGGAEDIGSAIWKALTEDLIALVHVGILRQLDELPMFVEGVDRDITSDLTTRLMFEPLGRFTEAMVRQYPEFTTNGNGTKRVTRPVWNPTTADWDEATFDLPSADGRPLLLVPNGWARPTLLMSATRFYEKTILDFAQIERAVRASNGTLIKTPKELLGKQKGLGPGRSTNIRLTLQALTQDENLVAYFKAFVDAKFDRPDDDDDLVAA